MTEEQWHQGFARCLGVYIAGHALEERDVRGRAVSDADFLMFFNGHHEPLEFTAPIEPAASHWTLRIDTQYPQGFPAGEPILLPGMNVSLEARSIQVYESPPAMPAPSMSRVGASPAKQIPPRRSRRKSSRKRK